MHIHNFITLVLAAGTMACGNEQITEKKNQSVNQNLDVLSSNASPLDVNQETDSDLSNNESINLVGGVFAKTGQFDESLRIAVENGSVFRGTCSATKIGPQIVATAFHCINGQIGIHRDSAGKLPKLEAILQNRTIWISNRKDNFRIFKNIPRGRGELPQKYTISQIYLPNGTQKSCQLVLDYKGPGAKSCGIGGGRDIVLIKTRRIISGIPSAVLDLTTPVLGNPIIVTGFGQRVTSKKSGEYFGHSREFGANNSRPFRGVLSFGRVSISGHIFSDSFTHKSNANDIENTPCQHAGDSGGSIFRDSHPLLGRGNVLLGVHSGGGRCQPGSNAYNLNRHARLDSVKEIWERSGIYNPKICRFFRKSLITNGPSYLTTTQFGSWTEQSCVNTCTSYRNRYPHKNIIGCMLGDAVIKWLPSQEQLLDRKYGLYSTGNYYTNWGGLNEKFIRSAKTNSWLIILPDGSLYQWLGVRGQKGRFIARFTTSLYTNPKLLHEAGN